MDIMALAANGADGGGILENFRLIIILVVIIVLGILLRRRRGAANNLEIAVSLIGDIRHNLKVLGNFSSTTPSFKKLKTGSWKRYGEKTIFLDEGVRHHMKEAFTLAQDFNDRLDEAKHSKSTSYLMGISTGTLEEAFNKTREGLATWIKDNYQTEVSRGRRGMFW